MIPLGITSNEAWAALLERVIALEPAPNWSQPPEWLSDDDVAVLRKVYSRVGWDKVKLAEEAQKMRYRGVLAVDMDDVPF